MMQIKTVVVDDEPLARARIIKLLENFEYIEVVSECKNGREALSAIDNYRPDLLFLDIQMPDLNGFDVLSDKSLHPLPFIIFVTAYDQYALKAFDVQAVDYLLKPFDEERFNRAVLHAYEQIQLKKDAALHKKMIQLLEHHQQSEENKMTMLQYKEKGIPRSVRLLDIHYFEADGNYLKAYCKDKSILLRQTLQKLEEALQPGQFIRIHRSLLINTNYLKAVHYDGNNQYTFKLKDGKALHSSRSYKEHIQEFLQGEEYQRLLK
jgi:two-component system LytT family response regulator